MCNYWHFSFSSLSSLSYQSIFDTDRIAHTSIAVHSSLLTHTQATLIIARDASRSEIRKLRYHFPSFLPSFSQSCLLSFRPSCFPYNEAHLQRPPKAKQRLTQETPQKPTQTQEPQSAQRERTTSSEQKQKNTQASEVGFDQVTSTRAMHRLVGDILGSMFYVR